MRKIAFPPAYPARRCDQEAQTLLAAAQEEPVPDTAPAVSDTVESGMPDAGSEDAPATEEVLIGSDVIQDAPSEPIHETAPLLDEGDEPSAA